VGDLLLWVFLVWALAHLFSDRQMITRALGMPLLMIFAAYGVFAIVGTEPRPKENSKYAACVNRGALNLGDIPSDDAHLDHVAGFCPAARSNPVYQQQHKGGLFDAMEADIAQKMQRKNQ